jgi:hypothetical protein
MNAAAPTGILCPSAALVSRGVRRLALALVLAALVGGCARGGESPSPVDAGSTRAGAATTPESASYRIDGRVIALQNGKHDEPVAPGSAARNTATVWGKPVVADLDGDGDQDAVMIIATQPGGSGTFYYVAVAELDGGAYTGSAGVLLGDRIAPQSVTFADGVVTVDYAERKPGEPMSVPPSVATRKRFVYRSGVLQPLEADKRF